MEPSEIKAQFPETISYLVRCFGDLGVNESKIVYAVLRGMVEKNASATTSMLSVFHGLCELTGTDKRAPASVVAELLGVSEEEAILQSAKDGTLQHISIAPWLQDYLDNR